LHGAFLEKGMNAPIVARGIMRRIDLCQEGLLQLVRYDPPVLEGDDPVCHFKNTRIMGDHHGRRARALPRDFRI
jgi:hypothetical protein